MAALSTSVCRSVTPSWLRALSSTGRAFAKGDDGVIRAELFSIERLEQHAESLAASHRDVSGRAAGRNLSGRLRDNGRVLLEAYRGIEQEVREDRAITPADEWLLDNFYVAQEQIRQIRVDLPRGFYRGLPTLTAGPLSGFPRVFGVAWELVAHTDSRFDRPTLIRFLRAYQRVQPLTIGELWAVAITLRIVLVENLRRSAEQIAQARAARVEADALADRLLGVGGCKAEIPAEALKPFGASPLSAAFGERFLQRLRDQDPRVTPALAWLSERLAHEGTTIEEIVRREHQRQGATTVTVRNVITSMRLISTLDWPAIFESVSLVDAALRVTGCYAAMDFPTRDRYRHAIEVLARGSRRSELDITHDVIATAAAAEVSGAPDSTSSSRLREPGYYLIANGRRTFERRVGFRSPSSQWASRSIIRAGIGGYVASVALLTVCLVAFPLFVLSALGVGGWTLLWLGLVALAPASELAVSLANRAFTHDLSPQTLPGLELVDGVPVELRTLLVIPTMLTTRDAIDEQIKRLEIHHLSSQDGDVRFALLSDLSDSSTETAPGDDDLLAAASSGIKRLNRHYGPAADGPRFLLLHRRRLWNEGQGRWIGWERKRGKLHELNRWLRGATDTTFVPVEGAVPEAPSAVRYVITLDADTRLPRGAAKRLVGKMAHPLNWPRLDPVHGGVVEGYGVLQPRVTPLMPPQHEGSWFQRVFTSPSGLDPYAFAVSDVYQDLFGEGSYVGKGIYDVDAFESALRGRIPESTLLSHDLLEGIFARAGLATDIEVIEEFPSRYDVSAARQHRWARGDWQLLPWILGWACVVGRTPIPAAISPIGRWKMLDNLRRTLTGPGLFLALVAGWLLPRPAAAVWSAYVIAVVAVPSLVPVFVGLFPRRLTVSWRRHWHSVGSDIALALAQVGLLVTLVAHQAWLMADAILRTLSRMFIRHRQLLEWTTAAQSQDCTRLDVRHTFGWMAGAVTLSVCAAGLVVLAQPTSWPVAAPFLLLWVMSPAVARWASLPTDDGVSAPLSEADQRALRLTARRAWRYFETFVTVEEHALPPDNFQEDPAPVVAHRTSPTNIGLYLLSVVAARDFGWLGTQDAVARLEATLASASALERFRGHFYNWYDTRSLRPLEPKFISTVDSGNLAGHLVAVETACRQMHHSPRVPVDIVLAGIRDGLDMTREFLDRLSGDSPDLAEPRRGLEQALASLSDGLAVRGAGDERSLLGRVLPLTLGVVESAHTLCKVQRGQDALEVLACAAAIETSVRSHLRDVDAARIPLAATTGSAIGADSHAAVAAESGWQAAARGVALVARNAVVAPDETSAGTSSISLRLEGAADRARGLFQAMDFSLLFDVDRQLLSIGYQVDDGRLDPSCYDLLASEARLASFVAIAKGDVPTRHWFHLGRTITPAGRGAALISWSGSMFEYVMPNLVMRSPPGSLLDLTNQAVVRRQIGYGTERDLPWGVSESAYNARDLERTYQYSSFGIPDLGLKRGLGDEAVVAPYATALAAMVSPFASVRNFERLLAAGARGRYGWYEALDYTPARLPTGQRLAVVRAFMAHHQGMTLVALANALHDGDMRARFHAAPLIEATELLLQERMPREVDAAHPRNDAGAYAPRVREPVPATSRRFLSPHQSVARTHLLSNGRYAVMMTVAGSGYSRWGDLAVTRWREDPTRDNWGSYIYLRDVEHGTVWSAGYQPTGAEPDSYETTFLEERIECVRRDGVLTTRLHVAVSPEDDAEARRVTISNGGWRTREVDVTSYAELVLAPDLADRAHPAFSNLFVQTEFVAEIGAVLATRRRRSPDEPVAWAAHLLVAEGDVVGDLQFETDRGRFLGRGHDVRAPFAVTSGRPLSNSSGAVLDPIFSLRRRITLAPGATAHLTFWTLVASSREALLDLVDRHRDSAAFERAGTLAWTQAQVQLFHLGIGPDEANLFQRLASHVVYSSPALRPASDVLTRSQGSAAMLWEYGVSGDLPIVVCRIDHTDDVAIVRQLLQAHAYWRMKQLPVDLVILNEHAASYAHDLQKVLEAMGRASQSQYEAAGAGTRGGVFVLRADLMSAQTRRLLLDVARAVLLSRGGSLFDQVRRFDLPERTVAVPVRRPIGGAAPVERAASRELERFNGLGGFDRDGREYVTVLGPGQWTPAPWINVIANPSFGFQVSADGAGYTWAINSQQHQLTPWSNDPVSDPPGEVLYVRDEDDGAVWTPTALPIRQPGSTYAASHGQGYSRFEHRSHGISLTLLQFVPPVDPVKVSRLTIRNDTNRARRLTVTAYVEWVLGASRSASAPFIATEIDSQTGAMLARNHWSADFSARVAFADLGGRQQSWTGDRREFIGRDGSLNHPAALAAGGPLSKRVGGGLDPCGALLATIDVPPHGTADVVFCLGEAASTAEAVALVARYRAIDLDTAMSTVASGWDDALGMLQVRTPDRAMDLMLNRWLLYQTLGCRVWARAAFYQASGAYGFRDQLQDVLALCVSRPAIARAHLLRAASRQFVEGDVQHWWLPPAGQGVRTRIADDRLWLVYAVTQYVTITGDARVFDEMVPFLDGPVLSPDQQEAYFLPATSADCATLFEHCARALDSSLAVGAHGLPLIGTGDWNDGLNRVGADGKGESVWLGWFLHATLSSLAPVAEGRSEPVRAATWHAHASSLALSLERDAWDGGWYRRAYFDDGSVLGGAANVECRIDSIPQSWSVMSSAALSARAQTAMAAVDEQLIRPEHSLALLFAPPFEHPRNDPGYIQGYPPGIRENGGQYTHAALWSVIAFAMLGDGDRAVALFDMLNPVNHGATPEAIDRYKVEPYVACADVYAEERHVGRGGWTWYTGSAGWMYRAGVEWILGFKLRGTDLLIEPCIPTTWPAFTITFRYHTARYEIVVENPNGVNRGVSGISIDGVALPAATSRVALVDDGGTHQVRVTLG